MAEERKYSCESLEDALAMLEAIEDFLKKQEEFQKKLEQVKARLVRLAGEKLRGFGYGGSGRRNRLEDYIEEMAEQAMAEAMEKVVQTVKAKQRPAGVELTPEEEREIDRALQKFVEAKKEVEEAGSKAEAS